MTLPRLSRALVPCLLLLGGAACTPAPERIAHVRVITRDYAFGIPATVPPGPTAFRLVNEGRVRHEAQLYRFKPWVHRGTALRMLATDEIPDSAIDVDGGVLISGPSDSTLQELLVTLAPGEVYALECVFRDGPDQPRHRDMGMVAIFQVAAPGSR